jgi:hypothetical protein
MEGQGLKIGIRLYADISLAYAKNFRQVRSHTLPTAELNRYPFLFALKSFRQ